MEATAVMAAVAAAADRQIQHVMIQDRSYFKSLKRNKTAGPYTCIHLNVKF